MSFRSKVLRAAGVLVVVAMLASCGGESLVPFNPSRILVFGDQASVVTLEPVPAEGKKFTINALNADGTFNCTENLIWIQVVAVNYGMGFPECPYGTGSAATVGRILAKPLATAGGSLDIDLAGQITRQLNKPAADGGGIVSTDLVTVFVGVNDVVELYKLYEDGASADEVRARAEAAGVAIANQVARIAAAGGKVIVATVPDVGLTPYGRSKDVAGRALLSALTLRVNNQFLLALQNSGNNNGREIGLIEINPYLISVVAFPPSYGYALDGVRDGACLDLPLPPNCTTQTLKAGATASTWLWANETQLTPKGHSQLGSLAVTRARNQPFQ
jgi:phospholipase/lecithinase/hemolysin